tara:strand:- start:724 stop:1677 length:954 start_codon:yes stop_codon:yes gene_type:complete
MILENLKQKIISHGGFINTHSHLDRAYTADYFSKDEQQAFLKEKWKLVDRIKKENTLYDFKNRINVALDEQKRFGVSDVLSFIDIDSVVGFSSIDAASMVRSERNDINLKIACQTLKGVLDKSEATLIESRLDEIDVIGSLPSADKNRQLEHLDRVMLWAKEANKLIHVHVDQLNLQSEKETEWLARKTMKWGLEGKVTAVHGISISCHSKDYRNDLYKMCKDAGLSFICCPSAWIDHPRTEIKSPTHNSLTPVDELLENDICVAIGSDNIHDIYKPYCNGDMMFELRLLLEAFKIYDDDTLIRVAVDNGKKAIGIK